MLLVLFFDGAGYNTNDTVAVRVYAYRVAPGGTVYSATPAQSLTVTSNDVFGVNWTWDTTVGADGYRLLRSTNSSSYDYYTDVGGNNFSDNNTAWIAGNTVTPASITNNNDTAVSIQVFAYRTLQPNGVRIYSQTDIAAVIWEKIFVLSVLCFLIHPEKNQFPGLMPG